MEKLNGFVYSTYFVDFERRNARNVTRVFHAEENGYWISLLKHVHIYCNFALKHARYNYYYYSTARRDAMNGYDNSSVADRIVLKVGKLINKFRVNHRTSIGNRQLSADTFFDVSESFARRAGNNTRIMRSRYQIINRNKTV